MIKVKRVVRKPTESELYVKGWAYDLPPADRTRSEEIKAVQEMYKKELTQTRVYILGRRIL